jgi:phosphoribosylamine--glycine ligase
LSIVLCSKGYPNEYKKNLIIKNIENIITDQNNFCFHAGTILKDNEILAVGGRVLNFISMANSFSKARQDVIKNIDILNWDSGFYRKDIGYKVIDE